MPAKSNGRRYSVRKAGTRNGKPHYSAECNVCVPSRVLAHGHLSHEAATQKCLDHLKAKHGIY